MKKLKKKEIDDNTIQSIRNLFRLKIENEGIKYKVFRDNGDLFKQKKEDSYKPVRIGIFRSKSYIEYESNGDRNKTLPLV